MTFDAERWLAGATIDDGIRTLWPEYRALLIVADRLIPGDSDSTSERILTAAEDRARAMIAEVPLDDQPHVIAWREAFRGFGAKPKRTKPSVEALLRRLPEGLPRVDRLTDVYNAISITHLLPVGGEDAEQYQGRPRLVRATSEEPFETTKNGERVVEHPTPGEVIWRDDLGVTCRRWNWRQCVRTRLTEKTTRAIFVLDALGPMTDAGLRSAGQAVMDACRELSPQAAFTTRLLGRIAGYS